MDPMEIREDKQLICDKLCDALQHTSAFWDLMSLTYKNLGNCTEIVTADFLSGKKIINVSIDSGYAMIRDIVEGLR